MVRLLVRALGLVALAAPAASAQRMITDRQYGIELYDGVALGSTQLVGMGGAGAALTEGTAGTLINPAAMAVRPTTDTDSWGWDFHVVYLNGALSTDYDNNGLLLEGDGQQLATFGLGFRYHDWAVAFTTFGQSAGVDVVDGADPNSEPDEVTFSSLRTRVVLSKWFPAHDLAVGIGANIISFGAANDLGGENESELFTISGLGLAAGATYVPRMKNWRAGLSFETPVSGGEVTSDCDPNDCAGYILPERIVSPMRITGGFAVRIAPTKWNQLVDKEFRDEPSLTLATDLVITGSSRDTYGLEAFALEQLQRSGASTAVSLRLGAECECIPGRVRLRSGTYWEPQRFEDVGGRLHATFGIDLRLLEVDIWGPRRGRLSFTADLAERYRNIAVSVGLWH